MTILNVSRSTRLKRDIAAASNFTIAASMIPTGGVSSLAGVYSVPRFLWTWKKHRIVKKALEARGLTIPTRTKRDYIIPATVSAVTGALGAGADSIAQFSDGLVPPDAVHEIPIAQWLGQVVDSAVETTMDHAQAVFDPGFAQELTEVDWENAYDPGDLGTHVENGLGHLDETFDTIMPGGLPLFSERTADLAGQTVAALVVGEMAGKAIETTAPKRRQAEVS